MVQEACLFTASDVTRTVPGTEGKRTYWTKQRELFQQVPAILIWQAEVADQNIKNDFLGQFDRRFGISRRSHGVPAQLQEGLEPMSRRRMIFNNKDMPSGSHTNYVRNYRVCLKPRIQQIAG